MTTTPHANLTGTDLHEIKGASTATAGQVPIANGSGGAPFGTLTPANLPASLNPFGNQLFHVREEQSPGVQSTAPSASFSYSNLPFTVIKTNEISGAGLGSNFVTLPAGTYFAEAIVQTASNLGAGGSANAAIKLQNISTGTSVVVGSHWNRNQAIGQGVENETLFLKGRFTLAAVSTIALQLAGNALSPYVAANFAGEVEVYTELLIWKIA